MARQNVHGPADEVSVRVLIQLPFRGVLFDASWIYPAALLVAPAGLGGAGVLPRWFARTSKWFAMLLLLMAGVGFIGSLDRIRFLTFPVFLIWVIVASVILLRIRAGPMRTK